MGVTVSGIYRFPVKGLSAEALDRVELTVGEGLPGDRRFALALAGSKFDAAQPEWLPKSKFLMLMRDERLATLQTHFDDASGILEICRSGKTVKRGNITTPVGRALIEDFFAAFMNGNPPGKPRLVQAPGHMFSDRRSKVVSIINAASVADLERIVGAPVDPLRFRGNLVVAGLEPWAEFDWLEREVAVGSARLRIESRNKRCPATDVNPQSGARDMNIPMALKRGYGHTDLGVYATIIAGGTVAAGDEIELR
ncbi:MAG: MOSC domain-containing protein [Rhodospirillales bacterium]|nr:MOSC domain-containing protein [Rhodospirillales bacterium]